MTCGVEWERLVAYWLRDGEDALEDHLFECDACTARLERLAALATAIRRRAHEGALRGAVTPEVLDRLVAEGVEIRRYEMPPGGRIHCSAGPKDDLVSVALRVPESALRVPRLDAVFTSTTVAFNQRIDDVPIAADGAVHWVEPGAFLRTLPPHVLEIRLMEGDRELACYTLNHDC